MIDALTLFAIAHPFRLIAAAILLVAIVDKGPWA
jgi:hypothetical protein